MSGEDDAVVRVSKHEWTGDAIRSLRDHVVRESPLEIRIQGVPIAVVMRTPGEDEDLCRGFMVTEGIVTHPRDIRSIRHCDIVDDQAAEGNTIMAVVRSSLELDVSALRRNLYTSSSCGICGKASIAAAMKVAPALTGSWVIDLQCVASLPDRLRTHQHAFSQTGGLHAAGLFTAQGVCKWVREDVGRHNAVDKVIGAAWDVGADLTAMALVVSGRVSFEIVQKALSARIPVIVAVSAPSSLAIELASGAGIGLAAFVRDGRVAIFATPRRFRGP